VKSLGLDDLKPFNPKEKFIELLLEDPKERKLVDLTITGFADETASESPAPGGGSVSAAMGAFGISLATWLQTFPDTSRDGMSDGKNSALG
jgi:glutamate formiminotransferase/formiminotetrahydrofolate cyclodeaminase